MRPAWIEVDLSAIEENIRAISRFVGPTTAVMAVVKANAYGHGLVPVAQVSRVGGASTLGVAILDEALTLRDAGVDAPILIMGCGLPEHAPEIIERRISQVVTNREMAEALSREAIRRGTPALIHVKVDTGMGRLGFEPEAVLPILRLPHFKGALRAEGVMTHLADADSDDPAYTESQIAQLRSIVKTIEAAGLPVPLAHAANSAAILCHPGSHLDLVRPGIMLYGSHTIPCRSPAPDLMPVLTLSTKVVQVRTLKAGESISYNRTFVTRRPSRIATLAIGYADGYRRSLSNRATVLLGGRHAPVVGQICMDMTLADVTDVPDVKPGQDAILIGRHGNLQISAADVAEWAGTIPYEILCGIGTRVKRRYVNGS